MSTLTPIMDSSVDGVRRSGEPVAPHCATTLEPARMSGVESELIALLAHDLRSPLNNVLMATELLSDRELVDERVAPTGWVWSARPHSP